MITSMDFDLTQPISFKEMHTNLKMLNLFCGKNGVGKSFILVNAWCLGTIANVIDMSGINEWAQFVYDKSLNSPLTGTISADFSGKVITLSFDKGKVTIVRADKIDDPHPIIYMSSAIRTFDSISIYLKMRKVVKEEDILSVMTDNFKLYDVVYIESLIKRCPIDIDEKKRQVFEQFSVHGVIAQIGVDLEKCDFYTVNTEGVKYLTSYGAGEQSIINMIIAQP